METLQTNKNRRGSCDIMKWLFALCLLIVFTHIVSATTYNAEYNLSKLPISTNVSYNFSLAPGGTMFFNTVQDDGNLTMMFPSNISFGNVSMKEALFQYSLNFFVSENTNYTIFEEIINVTNSINNGSQLLIFQVKVLNDPLPFAGDENYLIVSEDGKSIQIYTFSVIEFNQTHNVSIEAPPYSNVTVSCVGHFMSCDPIYHLGASPFAKIPIQIAVPRDTMGGMYGGNITLSRGNSSANIEMKITVQYRDDLYRIIQYDVWDESCYDTPERLAECYKEQARYNAEIANRLLERINSCNQQNATQKETVVINETIKYVEVGNVDEKLMKDYNKLRTQFIDLTSVYSDTVNQYNKCVNENNRLGTEVSVKLEQLGEEVLLKKSNITRSAEIEKQQYKQNTFKFVEKFVFYLMVLVFLLIVGGAYLKQRWVIQEYHPKFLWFLLFVVFVFWILLKYFEG